MKTLLFLVLVSAALLIKSNIERPVAGLSPKAKLARYEQGLKDLQAIADARDGSPLADAFVSKFVTKELKRLNAQLNN